MILKIVQYGDPVLREKGREVKVVDEKIKKLAEDMLETMREARGVGLAAQQIAQQATPCAVHGINDEPEFRSAKAIPIDEFCKRFEVRSAHIE